jgi:hypothetical protein
MSNRVAPSSPPGEESPSVPNALPGLRAAPGVGGAGAGAVEDASGQRTGKEAMSDKARVHVEPNIEHDEAFDDGDAPVPLNCLVTAGDDLGESVHLHWTNNQINVTTLTISETAKRIWASADNECGFDVFQICSFYCMKDGDTAAGMYCKARRQAILCLFTQLPILAYLYYELLSTRTKDWCDLDGKTDDPERMFMSYFAFTLSMYVSSRFYDLFMDAIHGGMYCVNLAEMTNLPDDVLDGRWLYVGCFYNSYVFLGAIVLCMYVIFAAETVFDMLLNSIALLFLVEMDDAFVSHADYKAVSDAFEDYKPKRERNSPADLPLSEAWFRFAFGFQVFTFIPDLMVMLLIYLAPVAIGVCY